MEAEQMILRCEPQPPPLPSATGVAQPEVSIDTTTELRWFFDGPIPEDVVSWFTQNRTIGLCEERRDAYRVDGHLDVGVKRRDGAVLELKVRQGAPEPFRDGEASGWLESWQRWSPADHLVDLTAPSTWLDVDKRVVKRRFGERGQEIPLTEGNRPMTGQACDVEIAAVSTGQRSAWTFAFAAFGPTERRPYEIESAWSAIGRDRPRYLSLSGPQVVSCGYPQWLDGQHARS